jgi:hypothetical protein
VAAPVFCGDDTSGEQLQTRLPPPSPVPPLHSRPYTPVPRLRHVPNPGGGQWPPRALQRRAWLPGGDSGPVPQRHLGPGPPEAPQATDQPEPVLQQADLPGGHAAPGTTAGGLSGTHGAMAVCACVAVCALQVGCRAHTGSWLCAHAWLCVHCGGCSSSITTTWA